MSFCGSPASQRSSFSSTYSPGCTSPNTAVTTPSSSGAISPKIGQSYTEYAQYQPPSPNDFDFNYHYSPTSPVAMNEYPYAYQHAQVPSPTPALAPLAPPPPPSSFSYYPPLPTSAPSYPRSYPEYSNSPPSPPPSHGSLSSAPPPKPKYSGYPPASAFYGPLPNPPTSVSSSSSRRYRRKSPDGPINPERYKVEPWYTADGRKVEYSAMHLHCATM